MLDDLDLLVCGAGPVGCVLAERAARTLGWRVLVIDRRDHIAGNCFDEPHENGVLVHRYGPHYFRTNNSDLICYLSQFTDWIPAKYEVRSFVRGQLFPFPINLTTMEKFFGRKLDAIQAEQILSRLRIPNDMPTNSEELVLSRVGRELYEAFFRGYTEKQWGLPASQLDAAVCKRIPIRLSRDCRYVEDRYQLMPARGFSKLFGSMLRHPRIRVLTDCDFAEVRELIRPRKATIYTGPIDAYFHYRLGKLPYRSLKFDFVAHRVPWVQPCVQINYPNNFPYTRTVEIKHVTGQQHQETVISCETSTTKGDPYYPVLSPSSHLLYSKYEQMAHRETRDRSVYFCGRLAQYKYFNTDEAIVEALACFEKIRERFAASVSSRPTVAA